MSNPMTGSEGGDQRLNDLLVAYIEAVEEGRGPAREEFLSRNPEFAEELAEFLAAREQLGGLAAVGPRAGAGGREGVSPEAADSRGAVGTQLPANGTLGDFRLVREIGRGGMGIVYEAVQISLNRRVALKVLPFAATMDPRHLQRFKNEARAAASLHHGHDVQVYAVGWERGVHYCALQ